VNFQSPNFGYRCRWFRCWLAFGVKRSKVKVRAGNVPKTLRTPYRLGLGLSQKPVKGTSPLVTEVGLFGFVDVLISFWGQKVEGQGHSRRRHNHRRKAVYSVKYYIAHNRTHLQNGRSATGEDSDVWNGRRISASWKTAKNMAWRHHGLVCNAWVFITVPEAIYSLLLANDRQRWRWSRITGLNGPKGHMGHWVPIQRRRI